MFLSRLYFWSNPLIKPLVKKVKTFFEKFVECQIIFSQLNFKNHFKKTKS